MQFANVLETLSDFTLPYKQRFDSNPRPHDYTIKYDYCNRTAKKNKGGSIYDHAMLSNGLFLL